MNKAWCLTILLAGCGGRPAIWDSDYSPQQAVGLRSSVAVVDPQQNRVLLLSSPAPLALQTDAVPVGLNVATIKASPDGNQLFVLSRGVQPRRYTTDQLPRLTIIDTTAAAGQPTPRVANNYDFTDPLSGLVLDAQMEWAIAYVTPADSRAVRNPNEINLIDLKNPDPIAAAHKITIQSGRGSPKSFLFTDKLTVPDGEPRRFLVVQTEHEVVLVDLLDAASGRVEQLRMELPHNQHGELGTPAQIVFHDAFVDDEMPNRNVPSEIAIRATEDSNVLLLSLAKSTEHAFDLKPNLLEVGGIPATIEFVNTNAGVRLLALVGTTAALVDPLTSNSVKVPLPTAFKSITRVTDDVAGATGGDVALLWSDQADSVGLWTLGASSTASHGLEKLEVGTTVSSVLDVPGDSFPTYKILESRQGDFFVLDLATQETSPMDTNGRPFSVSPSPDGERLWAYLPGSADFASIDLADLHATSLTTERAISGVFEIERPDAESPERSMVVLHQSNTDLAATVLDGLSPDSATTRFYSGLIYEGLTQ